MSTIRLFHPSSLICFPSFSFPLPPSSFFFPSFFPSLQFFSYTKITSNFTPLLFLFLRLKFQLSLCGSLFLLYRPHDLLSFKRLSRRNHRYTCPLFLISSFYLFFSPQYVGRCSCCTVFLSFYPANPVPSIPSPSVKSVMQSVSFHSLLCLHLFLPSFLLSASISSLLM